MLAKSSGFKKNESGEKVFLQKETIGNTSRKFKVYRAKAKNKTPAASTKNKKRVAATWPFLIYAAITAEPTSKGKSGRRRLALRSDIRQMPVEYLVTSQFQITHTLMAPICGDRPFPIRKGGG